MRFRISGSKNGKTHSLNAVFFGAAFESFPYCEGDRCDIVFTADINEYMGSRTPQLFVKEIRLSEREQKEISLSEERFKILSSGGSYDGAENDIPDLSDFRSIFRFIRRESGHEGRCISLLSSVRPLEKEFEISV